MFDIVPFQSSPSPESVLLWKEQPLSNIQYIPTVFIRNEIFQSTNSLDDLASKTYSLVKQIMDSQKLPFNEIQIDCDWTSSTKEKYFSFLEKLKKQKLIISSTLRLYQYKYQTTSGIPPCDYVTLMCYNMGNMKDIQAENSILNLQNLKDYTQKVNKYPKSLNIALPIFNWTLLYNNKQLSGIFYNTPNIENGNWKPIGQNKFQVSTPYYDTILFHNFELSNEIRIEKITQSELEKAKKYIQQTIKNTTHEIIYFDLDSSKIQNYFH